MTSVDLSVIGFPLKPPISFLFSEINLSLAMDVFEAITPSIEVILTNSMISSNWLSFKSGAIFNSIGFCFSKVLFAF